MRYTLVAMMAALLACSTTSSTVRPQAEPMTMKPVPAAPANNHSYEYSEENEEFYDTLLSSIYDELDLAPPPAMSDPAFPAWVKRYRKSYQEHTTLLGHRVRHMWAIRGKLRNMVSRGGPARERLHEELAQMSLVLTNFTLVDLDLTCRTVAEVTANMLHVSENREGSLRASQNHEVSLAALATIEAELKVRRTNVEGDFEKLANYFEDK